MEIETTDGRMHYLPINVLLFCSNASQIDAASGLLASHALCSFDMSMAHGLAWGTTKKPGIVKSICMGYL